MQRKAIFTAAVENFRSNEDVLKKILANPEYKQFIDLKIIDYFGDKITALEYALLSNDASKPNDAAIKQRLMLELLSAGANPNVGIVLPVVVAAELSSPDFLRILLTHHKLPVPAQYRADRKRIKTDVNGISKDQKLTALQLALYKNKTENLKLLLAQPEIDIYKVGCINEANAFKIAFHNKYLECMDLLVEKAASTDITLTPVIVKIIAQLLQQGYCQEVKILLNKIKTPIETKNTKLLRDFKSLIFFILKNEVDIELYNIFIQITGIKINDVLYLYDDSENTHSQLSYCATSQENHRIMAEWATYLLKTNTDTELDQIGYKDNQHLLTAAAVVSNIELCKVLLETEIPKSAIISIMQTILNTTNNNEILSLLSRHIGDTSMDCSGPTLSIDLLLAIIDDNVKDFWQIFSLEKYQDQIYLILEKIVLFNKQKILRSFLNSDFSIFQVNEQSNCSIFSEFLFTKKFTVVDALFKLYLEKEHFDALKNELTACKNTHLQNKITPVIPLDQNTILQYTSIVMKIVELEKQLEIATSLKSEMFAISSSSQTLFSTGISGRKFVTEELGLTLEESSENEKPKKVERAIEPEAKVPSACFSGQTIFFLAQKEQVENATQREAYIKFMPDIDCSPEKLFTEKTSRFIFGEYCLKRLNDFNDIKFSINGKTTDAKVTHELKVKGTTDRILIATLPSDDGKCDMLVAFYYVPGGLHTTALKDKTRKSIKDLKVISLDFLLAENKNEPMISTLKRS